MTAIRYVIGGRPWVISGDAPRPVLDSIATRVADDLGVAATLNPNGYEQAYERFVAATKGRAKPARDNASPGADRFSSIIAESMRKAVEEVGKPVVALRFTPLHESAN